MPEATLDVTALPDCVREVIGARVLRLGKEAGRILSVAAVIGRDFDLDLLAASTNTDEDDVLDVLDAAAEVSLVREPADRPGTSASPTPSSSTRSTRTWAPPDGPVPTAQWPRRWRSSAVTIRAHGWASWPATGATPPSRSTSPRRSPMHDRPATPRSPHWSPDEALRYYRQALELCDRVDVIDADPRSWT